MIDYDCFRMDLGRVQSKLIPDAHFAYFWKCADKNIGQFKCWRCWRGRWVRQWSTWSPGCGQLRRVAQGGAEDPEEAWPAQVVGKPEAVSRLWQRLADGHWPCHWPLLLHDNMAPGQSPDLPLPRVDGDPKCPVQSILTISNYLWLSLDYLWLSNYIWLGYIWVWVCITDHQSQVFLAFDQTMILYLHTEINLKNVIIFSFKFLRLLQQL
jgi:hypothetical protein